MSHVTTTNLAPLENNKNISDLQLCSLSPQGQRDFQTRHRRRDTA